MQQAGSCLCRKVRFTVLGDPFQYVVCHCNLSVTAGKDLVRQYHDSDTASGNTLTRSFCSECGTSLFLSSPTKTDWISVCPATVDQAQDWVPRRENRPDAKFSWVTELHMAPEDKAEKL
ncbi:Mss4-like protein [Mycena rosella]|uniref:Mss4-like protein n=1 Tax=Mycena rosella TaxID=1033263 RepID=A0AAD7DRH7_MYCRO|nr:Mss4-like protein [Mycena rosella]